MYTPKHLIRVYLTLTLLSTLSASLIWGINTLFLLDAGLSNTQAFTVNAFFTAGMVLFEIPTGVIADLKGRRLSYLLGVVTLFFTTIFYYLLWVHSGPFWLWAIVSALLGLGFTFFSGAVEAWLVDALTFSGFKGDLDSVFAKGQIVGGIAMLSGAIAGGLLAQFTSLGVPYIVRSALLLITFVVAFATIRDVGFVPEKEKNAFKQMGSIVRGSIDHGLKNPPVRWLMLAAPFTAGVGIFAFYALQPYLLELYGNPEAYSIAGLAAAIVAGSQIVGGLIVPLIRRKFKKRTSILLTGIVISSLALFTFGFLSSFWIALIIIVVWGVVFASLTPIRQAFINGLIPSKQRATVLSFDSLMGSAGGVVVQPVLGKAADVYSYSAAYIFSALITLLALPFTYLARKENVESDIIKHG